MPCVPEFISDRGPERRLDTGDYWEILGSRKNHRCVSMLILSCCIRESYAVYAHTTVCTIILKAWYSSSILNTWYSVDLIAAVTPISPGPLIWAGPKPFQTANHMQRRKHMPGEGMQWQAPPIHLGQLSKEGLCLYKSVCEELFNNCWMHLGQCLLSSFLFLSFSPLCGKTSLSLSMVSYQEGPNRFIYHGI